MSSRFLAPLAWLFWGALVIVLVYGLFRVSTDRSSSPEGGRGLGYLVLGVLLVIVAIIGVLLYLAIKTQSPWGTRIMLALVAYPIVMLVAIPVVKWYQTYSFESAYNRVGDFKDPALKSFAQAIATGDTATLTTLLAGKAPPAGMDRAGNDLLAYSAVAFRDRRGHSAPIRILLEAGADPRTTRMGENKESLLNYLVLGMDEERREVIRWLLAHKADPNFRDPITNVAPLANAGDDAEVVRMLVEHGADIDAPGSYDLPAVVGFISQQKWDSAIYLINKGARLDVEHGGLSVDYWLKEWKDTIYGAPLPEGWLRVREAIAARRGQSPPP